MLGTNDSNDNLLYMVNEFNAKKAYIASFESWTNENALKNYYENMALIGWSIYYWLIT